MITHSRRTLPSRLYSVVVGGVISVVVSSSAVAQETITFDIRFAHPVLNPGLSQTIEVWAVLEPGIAQPAVWNTHGGTGQIGYVIAFELAEFDLVNAGNGQTGVFSNLQTNPTIVSGFPNVVGTPTANGGVSGVFVVQFNYPWLMNLSNPIWLWSAEWTPTTYDPRVVAFDTLALQPPRVWLDVGLGAPHEDDWLAINVPSSFQVVPAAPITAFFALASLFGARRRR